MSNIVQKKKLKTLQLSDWASFIEDTNYNFSVIMSSPLFVGTEGPSGSDGKQGAPGIRGSKWLFVELSKFQEQFPEDSLSGEYQITIDYLNKKLLNETAKTKLLKATGAGNMFVDGDVVVSNAKIILLDLSQNKFIDTGESISSNSELFLQNIEKQVIQLVNDTLKNDPVYMGLTQTVDLTLAQAKNYVDGSGNINNQINENSMLDIKTPTAKPGAEIETHKMFTPAEKMYDPDNTLTWIFGAAEKYHEIIQRTLEYNSKDATSNTIGDFGPTVKNPPAVVILQNTQTSGVMIGHRTAKKFTDFARVFVNADNAFVLSSPNVSDHYLKFSEILLYNDKIEIVTNKLNVKSPTTFSGNVNILDEFGLSHKWLSVPSTGLINIGSPQNRLNINAQDVYFTELPKTDFVSIDADHKITSNSYSVDKAETVETLSKRSDRVITSNQLWLVYEYAKSSGTGYDEISKQLTKKIDDSVKILDTTDRDLQKQISDVRGSYTGSLSEMDVLHTKAITDLNIPGIRNSIAKEIIDRTAGDASIQSEISTLKSGSFVTIPEILISIANETTDRKSADTTLKSDLEKQITTETTERKTSDIGIRGGYTGSMNDLKTAITDLASTSGSGTTALSEKLNQEIDSRKLADTDLRNSLNTETAERKASDVGIRGGYAGSMNDLQLYIKNIETGTGSSISDLAKQITTETTERKTSNNIISNNLSTNVDKLTVADAAIRGGYTGSMTDLLTLINTITGGSGVDITSLLAKITAETTNRETADSEIRGGYTSSMTDLMNALKLLITAETDERKAVDTTLDTKITAISESSKTLDSKLQIQSGMIIDLYVKDSGSYQNVRNKLFAANGQGKTNVTYSTPVGTATNVNLSKFWLCDGTTAPDLRNTVVAGASETHAIGTTIGTESLMLQSLNIPKHTHAIAGAEVSTNQYTHGHSLSAETSLSGLHNHNISCNSYKVDHSADNYRDIVTQSGTTTWSSAIKEGGSHQHSVSGITSSDTHDHNFTIPPQITNEQYTGSQAPISVVQPTIYCFKVMCS